MKVRKFLLPAIALLAFTNYGALQTQAQQHPAYLHALSDLRLMRAYLQHPTPTGKTSAEEQYAIDEINAAIQLIKQASVDDGKPMNYQPPVDAHLTPGDRFRQAREAGNAAWQDINKNEDNDWAYGLKRHAQKHIEHANHTIDHIISQLHDM